MARRMAGIRRRKDGTFEKRFTIEGQRYSVYGKTQKECIENEMKRREEIANGIYKKNGRITLDQYFNEWIEQKKDHIRAITLHHYSHCYKIHISPVLGKRRIQNIERREIIDFQRKLTKRNMAGTVVDIMALLSQIMKYAINDEIITRNVCDNIPRPKMKSRAGETIHRALTAKELAIFFKYAGNDFAVNAFRLMLETGMRAGECCALQWRDIDYKNGVIHIRRTVTRNEAGKRIIGKTTKTEKSTRNIPINSVIHEILESQRALFVAIHGGKLYNINATVFWGNCSDFLTGERLNDKINNVLAKAEKAGEPIRHFSSHAFRDTFASMAAMKGVPMNVLKELLGHSSYAMTADKYCHPYEEQKREAMENLSIAK